MRKIYIYLIVIACILLYTYNRQQQEGFGLSDATAPITATFRPIIRKCRQFLEEVVKKITGLITQMKARNMINKK